MDSLRQDVVYAARSLRRDPGFTTIVVLTLTVGIGALTAIFSVVNGVLLQPLPFDSPDRIVQVWSGPQRTAHGPTSPANFVDWRTASRSFDAVAAEDFAWYDLTSDSAGITPERRFAALVSPAFFRVVGVQPAIGRGFTPDEERADARVAVLGHSLWQQRFSGNPAVVGRSMMMNGERYEVIGVMPEGFDFPSALIGTTVDLWVPLAWTPDNLNRGLREVGITARLAPGVTVARAQSETDAIARQLASAFPAENEGVAMRLVPLHDEMVGGVRRVLLVLLGAVGLVLLIACANVANLLLTRAQSRQKEITLRAALGAGRARIVRQLLTEALLLAFIGGLFGTIAAAWLTDALVALGPEGLPRLREIDVDATVLFFALGTTALSGIVFGLVPALHASSHQLGDALRSAGRALTGSHDRRRLRHGIIVLEVAMALVLLVGAGLLLRSLDRLLSVHPGFEASSVLTARVVLPPSRYIDDSARTRFLSRALDDLRAIPLIRSAAAVDYVPFGQGDANFDITVEGLSATASAGQPSAHYRAVTGDYFAAMRIPVKAGRALTDADRAGASLVAVVNEEMARRYWPGKHPAEVIGRRIRIGNDDATSEWHTIVGIVGDVKHWSLAESSSPQLYFSLRQAPAAQFTFVLETVGDAAGAGEVARQALLGIDPDQPATIRPMSELVSATMVQPRFRSILLGTFALLALLLAVIGIYGVISHGVAQRTREIGVRLALGAQRGDIVNLVLREGMLLTVGGLTVGVVGALALTRLIRGMLFDVTTYDAATFIGVSVLLAATAALANYLPARRAARVDPMVTMQVE